MLGKGDATHPSKVPGAVSSEMNLSSGIDYALSRLNFRKFAPIQI